MKIEPIQAWVIWALSLVLPSASLGSSLLLVASGADSSVGIVIGFLGLLVPLVVGFALAVRVDQAPLWVRLLWASLPWPIVAIQVVVFAVLGVMTMGPPVGA